MYIVPSIQIEKICIISTAQQISFTAQVGHSMRMAASTKPSTLTARFLEIPCTLIVLPTRFKIASKEEMHGKDQVKCLEIT